MTKLSYIQNRNKTSINNNNNNHHYPHHHHNYNNWKNIKKRPFNNKYFYKKKRKNKSLKKISLRMSKKIINWKVYLQICNILLKTMLTQL
jgi:hypothetical protein